MISELRLTLPVPPSTNALFANRKSGIGKGRIKTKAYRAWIVQADRYYLAQKRDIVPMRGACDLTIYIPSRSRADSSNLVKAAEDYLVSRELTGDDRHNRTVTVTPDPQLTDHCVVVVTAARAPEKGWGTFVSIGDAAAAVVAKLTGARGKAE